MNAQKKELLVIFFIFALSFFLRVYRLPEFISYHQDQIRDLFYIKEHFDRKEFILLGPKASVGDFYLPPFWYYLTAVAYIFTPFPIAPAFLVAIFNSLTTVMIFLLAKKFFDQKTALFSSLLYAVSPLSIEYSRFAWNPNPIPFFVILTFYFLYLHLFEKKDLPAGRQRLGFYLGTISANLAFQLHYQGLIILLFFLFTLILQRKIDFRKLVAFILLNILLFAPFIFYELRNQFLNTQGVIKFLFNPTIKLKFLGVPFFIRFIYQDFTSFLADTLYFKYKILGILGLLFLILSLLFIRFENRRKNILKGFILFSLVMLYFYKNSLINFYLLFLIPIIIIYTTTILFKLIPKLAVFILAALFLINLIKSPAFGKTDDTYMSIKNVVETTSSRTQNYCLVYDIFSETFIERKLRYLFSLSKNPPQNLNCEKILYYMSHREIEKIYYLCQPAICQRAKTIPKFDFSRVSLIDQGKHDAGVEVYEIKQ